MQQNYNTLLLSFILILFSVNVYPKDPPKYPTTQIPLALTENANSVVRNDDTSVEIISPSKVTVKRSFAITILKESALDDSKFSIGYGKFNRVSDIEAIVYGPTGEKIKKIKTDEILDVSDIANGTIYSDYRRKLIDPKYQSYPFTIEYEYTVTYSSAFFLPSWTVFHGYNTSVERSSFTINVPDSYELRYSENKISHEAMVPANAGTKTYKWSASGFKARNPEPYSPDEEELFPYVTVAPSTFEIGDYSGSMQTWKDFGQFITELNAKQNKLPEETRQTIKNLVKDCTDDYEKVKRIYEYAQKKNRYISVQVGIGGWQSIDAETVDRLSYGDCKALSNYTKTLLEAAGIKAICALVGAGDHVPYIDSNFARNAFNHMIVCVPLLQDSVWLECTNSFLPAGYLGDFTNDRYALLIEGSESRLVRTPKFEKCENAINTSGEAILKPDGNASATFAQNYNGSFYGDYLSLKLIDEKDRRDALVSLIEIPNFKISTYSIEENKNRKPSINLKLNLDLSNYATIMGPRMILKINQLNAMNDIPRFIRKREFNLEIRQSRVENDTIVYQLPTGYQVESLPPPVEITSDFGSFKCQTILNNRSIQMIRHLEIYKGVSEPEKYNKFREFLEKVATSDNAKCVLIKS